MKLKKGFYKDYELELRKEKEEERIRDIYKVPQDKPIVIMKGSNGVAKFFRLISNMSIFLFKLICYLTLTLLSSIGATVLLNQGLREQFINMFFR